MTTAPLLGNTSELRELYAEGSARIQQSFFATGDGRAALAQRTALVESILLRLWQELISSSSTGPQGFALVAIGGFGRKWLFPHSDIDLLFLHAGRETEAGFKDRVRRFSQELWDLRMKLSPTTRTLAECDRFDTGNIEFSLSLLDCRYLAGDREVFQNLREKVLPKLVTREAQPLVQRLVDITRDRHAKYGGTVFHLEPNVKETPGGLRDYNVTCWLPLISAIDKLRAWPEPAEVAASSPHKLSDSALDFLIAVRCFLHLRNGRDDNLLSWEAQDEAAARNIGTASASTADAAQWMRRYFSFARDVNRTTLQLLEEIPANWSSLYRQFQSWRSRLSNADFSVVHGMLYFQQPPAAHDLNILLRLFDFMAHHGLKLSTTTEQRIQQVLPELPAQIIKGSDLWMNLQVLLLEPHAADALREMHSLGLLTILLPELKSIDSLVIRDFYHRFTVDEHSFLTIESLHRAKQSPSEWDRRYGQILEELEQPELLYLSLLLHDVGKGVPTDNHVTSSLEIAEGCLERLEVSQEGRDIVRFLIGNHLEISATLRRDIFDPQTIAAFAEKVGTPERLKMLCLLTYADIKAVNPEALTPWKAEAVWQLYISTANYLNHSVDQRFHGELDESNLSRLRSLAPAMAKKIKPFLDGLPNATCAATPRKTCCTILKWRDTSRTIRCSLTSSAAGTGMNSLWSPATARSFSQPCRECWPPGE